MWNGFRVCKTFSSPEIKVLLQLFNARILLIFINFPAGLILEIFGLIYAREWPAIRLFSFISSHKLVLTGRLSLTGKPIHITLPKSVIIKRSSVMTKAPLNAFSTTYSDLPDFFAPKMQKQFPFSIIAAPWYSFTLGICFMIWMPVSYTHLTLPTTERV